MRTKKKSVPDLFEKGARIVLPRDIEALVFTLSWAVIESDENTDLDAGVMIFDDEGNQIDAVHFARLSTSNGSVRHLGDAVSAGVAGGDDDFEQIVVSLDRLADTFEVLHFVINNYTGTFRDVKWAQLVISEVKLDPIRREPLWVGAHRIAAYRMEGGGEYRATLVCKLHRMHPPRRRRALITRGGGQGGKTTAQEPPDEEDKAATKRLPPMWRGNIQYYQRRMSRKVSPEELQRIMVQPSVGDRPRAGGSNSMWALHMIGDTAQGPGHPDLLPLVRSSMLDVLPHIDPDPSQRKVQSVNEIVTLLDIRAFGRLEHAFRRAAERDGLDGLAMARFVQVLCHHLGWRADVSAQEVADGEGGEDGKRLVLVKELYSQIDVDGDGTVTWEEFTSFCVEAGMAVTRDAEVQEDPGEKYIYVDAAAYNAKCVPAVSDGIRWAPELDAAIVCERDSTEVKFLGADGSLRPPLAIPQPKVERGHRSGGAREGRRLVLDAEHLPELGLLAVSVSDLAIQLWRTDESVPSLVGELPCGLTHGINKSQSMLRWSRASLLLFSTANDATINVWDPRRLMHLRQLKGHGDRVTEILDLAESGSLVTSSMDRTIRLWNLTTLQQRDVLRGHTKGIKHMAYCNRSRLLLSCGFEFDVMCWDVDARRIVSRLRGHRLPLVGIALVMSDRMPRCVSADEGGTFRLWNLMSGSGSGGGGATDASLQAWTAAPGTAIRPLSGFIIPSRPSTARDRPYTSLLAVGASRVVMFRQQRLRRQELAPACALFNPSTMSFFVAVGRSVHVYSARTGQLLRIFADVTESPITQMHFDARHRRALLCTQSGGVGIYNAVNGQVMQSHPNHSSAVIGAAVFAGHRVLVTASHDGALNVLDDRGSQRDDALMRGVRGTHVAARTAAATCSERLDLCLTGGSDGTVNAWGLSTASLLAHTRAHRTEITAIHIVDPYNLAVTADATGTVAILALPSPTKARGTLGAGRSPSPSREGKGADAVPTLVVVSRFRYRPPPLKKDPAFAVPITFIQSKPSARDIAMTAQDPKALVALTPASMKRAASMRQSPGGKLTADEGDATSALGALMAQAGLAVVEEAQSEADDTDTASSFGGDLGSERPPSTDGRDRNATEKPGSQDGSVAGKWKVSTAPVSPSVSTTSRQRPTTPGSTGANQALRERVVAALEEDSEDAAHTLLVMGDDAGWVSKWSLSTLLSTIPPHERPSLVADAQCPALQPDHNPWRRYNASARDFDPHRLARLHEERERFERQARRERRRFRGVRARLKVATGTTDTNVSDTATFMTQNSKDDADPPIPSAGIRRRLPNISQHNPIHAVYGWEAKIPSPASLPRLHPDWLLTHWRPHSDSVVNICLVDEPPSAISVSYDRSVRVHALDGKYLGTVLSDIKQPDAPRRKGEEEEWVWKFRCRTRLEDAASVVKELADAHSARRAALANRKEEKRRLEELEGSILCHPTPKVPLSPRAAEQIRELKSLTAARMRKGRRRAAAVGQLLTAVKRQEQVQKGIQAVHAGVDSSDEENLSGDDSASTSFSSAGSVDSVEFRRRENATVASLLGSFRVSSEVSSASTKENTLPVIPEGADSGDGPSPIAEQVRRELELERRKAELSRNLPRALSQQSIRGTLGQGTYDGLERAWLQEAVNRGLANALHRDVMGRFVEVEPVSMEDVSGSAQAQAALNRMRRTRAFGRHGNLSRYSAMKVELDRKNKGKEKTGIHGDRPTEDLLTPFNVQELGPLGGPEDHLRRVQKKRHAEAKRRAEQSARIHSWKSRKPPTGSKPSRKIHLSPLRAAQGSRRHPPARKARLGVSASAPTFSAPDGFVRQPRRRAESPPLSRAQADTSHRSPLAQNALSSMSDAALLRLTIHATQAAASAADAAAAAASAASKFTAKQAQHRRTRGKAGRTAVEHMGDQQDESAEDQQAPAADQAVAERRRQRHERRRQQVARDRAAAAGVRPGDDNLRGFTRRELLQAVGRGDGFGGTVQVLTDGIRQISVPEERSERSRIAASMRERAAQVDAAAAEEDFIARHKNGLPRGLGKRTSLLQRQNQHAVKREDSPKRKLNANRIGPYRKADVLAAIAVFAELDKSGTGRLHPAEFVVMMQRSGSRGLRMIGQEAQSMFLSVDRDNDGGITLAEMLRVLFSRASSEQRAEMLRLSEQPIRPKRAVARSSGKLSEADVEEFRQLFNLYDTDGDGVLSVSEIVAAFSALYPDSGPEGNSTGSSGPGGLTKHDVVRMFKDVDVNNDHVLDFDEFLILLAAENAE